MRRVGIVVLFTAIAAFAAAPAAERPAVPIPRGVTVDGIAVGGLTSEPARMKLRLAFDRPLRFVLAGKRWSERPSRFGATAAIDETVSRALKARPFAKLTLGARPSQKKVRGYVASLDRRFGKKPVDAAVNGVTFDLRPNITEAKQGLRVDRQSVIA